MVVKVLIIYEMRPLYEFDYLTPISTLLTLASSSTSESVKSGVEFNSLSMFDSMSKRVKEVGELLNWSFDELLYVVGLRLLGAGSSVSLVAQPESTRKVKSLAY